MIAVPPCGLIAATASAIVARSRAGPVTLVMCLLKGAMTTLSSSRRWSTRRLAATRTKSMLRDMLWLLSTSSTNVAGGASAVITSMVCRSPFSRSVNWEASRPPT